MSNLGARGGAVITEAAWSPDDVRARAKPRSFVHLGPQQRAIVIITAATVVAKRNGIMGINWRDVLEECKPETAMATARRTFTSLMDLRKAVAERAKRDGDQELINQGRAHGLLK